MSWFITTQVEEFLAVAGEFLQAEPARNSVVLTVTENLRIRAAAQSPPAVPDTRIPDPDQPLFGWWRPPASLNRQASQDSEASQAPVSAVFMHTPEFPVQLSFTSTHAAAELARDLATNASAMAASRSGKRAVPRFQWPA